MSPVVPLGQRRGKGAALRSERRPDSDAAPAAARVVASWERLGAEGVREGRLRAALLDNASELIALFASGVRISQLGRLVVAAGVTTDGGAPLKSRVFVDRWVELECALIRRARQRALTAEKRAQAERIEA